MSHGPWSLCSLVCVWLVVAPLVPVAAGLEFRQECTSRKLLCPATNTKVDDCKADCSGYSVDDLDDKECIDRKVFGSKFLWNDLVAAFLWFVAAAFATAAGVGGGGIYVPLGMMLLRFAAKPATGLSQCSIFGAASAGLLINSQSRHPKADRPVIDLDMALILAPMEMSGALLGVIVQATAPEWFVIIIMVLVLGYTAFRTFKSGLKQMQQDDKYGGVKGPLETESQSSKSEPNGVVKSIELNPALTEPGSGTGAGGKEDEATADSVSPDEVNVGLSRGAFKVAHPGRTRERMKHPDLFDFPEYTVEEWLERDSATPLLGYFCLLVLWMILVLVLFIKGGHGLDSMVGVECEDWGYWMLTLVEFVWLFGFSLLMARRAVKKTERKRAVNFKFVDGDVQWDWSGSVVSYMAKAFGAGAIAGLVGIGGGMVLGPLMLQMNVLPQVSTATTATMIVLTSSAVAVGYVIGGLVPISYAGVFCLVCFCGAFVGKKVIDKIVKQHNWNWLLIFILGTIIALATVMVFIAGIVEYDDHDWCLEGLTSPCKH